MALDTNCSTNEANTVNVQVSIANSLVSTDSTLDSTANLSDATVYGFLANQPNGSQLVHEDLEEIHDDDLEEIDLKWELALLSMESKGSLFAPSIIDLSYSGLKEFQQPEVQGYGPKSSKSVCVDTSNEVKTTPATLLVEELVSEKEKQTVFPTKIEFVKQQDKTARKPVKYAEMYKSQKPRGNQRNWNNLKSQQLGSDSVIKHVLFVGVLIIFKLIVNTIKGKGWPKAVNTARPNSAVINTVRDNQATFPISYISKSLIEDMSPLVEESEEEKSLVKNSITYVKHGWKDMLVMRLSIRSWVTEWKRAATTASSLEACQGSGTMHKTPTRPYNSPLPRVHTLGSDEGSLQQNELMDLVTKLTDRVEVLENDMQQTKKVYSSSLTKLILRVKKLEKKVKTNKARRRARIVILEDKDAKEDSSK
ncbi:hypothetical protein Tco_1185633 [Tanacetum coccineum]